MPLFQAHISEQTTQLNIFRQLECNNTIKKMFHYPEIHQQSMIYYYRGAYIAAVYLAGPQNPY